MKLQVEIEHREDVTWSEHGGKLTLRDAYLVHPRSGGFHSSSAGLTREAAMQNHREHVAFLMRKKPEDIELEVVR